MPSNFSYLQILPGLLEDWIRLTFNGVCTMPILPPGCMDQAGDPLISDCSNKNTCRAQRVKSCAWCQDFREQIILKNPKQYQVGPNSEDLNSKKVVAWHSTCRSCFCWGAGDLDDKEEAIGLE